MALKFIDFGDLRDGLNTQDSSTEIRDSQSPALQNVDLSSKGKVTTRDGKADLNTSAIATATGIFGAFYGKSKHLAATLAAVYKLNTSSGAYESLQGSLTSNSWMDFEEWQNYVYMVNGADTVYKWDGSSVTALGGVPTAWTANKPNYICQHEERLFTLTSSTSLVSWCAQSTPEDWTTADDAGYQSISPNDGFTGTGIISQRSGVLVLKQVGLYKITGSTPASFRFPAISYELGCVAPRSIVNVNNVIYFLAKYRGHYGVYGVDESGGIIHFSDTITPTLDTIATATDYLAAAVLYNDKYILSFKNATEWVTVALNYKSGSWEYESGIAAQCYYVVGNSLYGGSTSVGDVHQLYTGTSDDGVAITSYARCKTHTLGFPEIKKHLKYITVWVKASGSYDLNINLRLDDILYPKTFKVQLGTGGGIKGTRVEKIPLNIDTTASLVNVQFGTSTLSQPFELYSGKLWYEMDDKISTL